MAKSGAQRQREFVAKMKAEGRVRTVLWLTKEESAALSSLSALYCTPTKQAGVREILKAVMESDKQEQSEG
jgi:hypothetical protein